MSRERDTRQEQKKITRRKSFSFLFLCRGTNNEPGSTTKYKSHKLTKGNSFCYILFLERRWALVHNRKKKKKKYKWNRACTRRAAAYKTLFAHGLLSCWCHCVVRLGGQYVGVDKKRSEISLVSQCCWRQHLLMKPVAIVENMTNGRFCIKRARKSWRVHWNSNHMFLFRHLQVEKSLK